MTSVVCGVASHSRLECTTPPWLWASGPTRVSLTRRWMQWTPEDFPSSRVSRAVDEELLSGGAATYTLLPEVTGVAPVSADRHAGVVMTVAGRGFSEESVYTCRLNGTRDGAAAAVEHEATFSSPNALLCGPVARWTATWGDELPTVLDFALLSDLANYSDTPVCGNVSSGVRNVTECFNATEVVNMTNATGIVRFVGGDGVECEFDGGAWVDQEGDANCTAVRDTFYFYFDENGTRCVPRGNETVEGGGCAGMWANTTTVVYAYFDQNGTQCVGNETEFGNETEYLDSEGGECNGTWVNETNASYAYLFQNGTECVPLSEGDYVDSEGGNCTGMWVTATNASNASRTYEVCTTHSEEPIEEVCVTPPEPFVLAPSGLDLALLYINKAPSFRGRNLVIPGSEHPPLYNMSWVLESSPGTLANGTEAYDELWQRLEFRVEKVDPHP